MEFPKASILTPYNYHEWKDQMARYLRQKGLYRITMATEVEPTSAIEKSKYLNRMDEAHGSICMCISPELQFHLSACNTPNEIWKKVEDLYGKQDEMKGHLLEVELLSLDPQNCDKIQDFFTKYMIYCCNSRVVELTNPRRRVAKFSLLCQSSDHNTPSLCLHFIQ